MSKKRTLEADVEIDDHQSTSKPFQQLHEPDCTTNTTSTTSSPPSVQGFDASTWYDTLRTQITQLNTLESRLENNQPLPPDTNELFDQSGQSLFEYHAYHLLISLSNRIIKHLFGTWECLSLMDRDYWRSQTSSLINLGDVALHLDLTGRVSRHPRVAQQNIEAWKHPITQFFHGGPVPDEEYQDLEMTIARVLTTLHELNTAYPLVKVVWCKGVRISYDTKLPLVEEESVVGFLGDVVRRGGGVEGIEDVLRPLVWANWEGEAFGRLREVGVRRCFPSGTGGMDRG